jgi:hypothetical protein
LLDLATGAALLPLRCVGVMTGHSPETAQESPIISTTASFTEHQLFCGNARLKDSTPAAQILEGHTHAFRNDKFRGAVTRQPCLDASERSNQDPLYWQSLGFGN